jgi:ABC-2 type transport system ATP-binding protein
VTAIRIDGVEKRFGDTYAVRDLSLEVPEGSLCGFLGPNGAGKSTTIRMIMSIIYPDRGRIEVLGGSALDSKDRIGYLPEERGVYRKMRVGEFVRYVARLKGVDRRGFDRVVEDWLDRIELPGVARKKCEELSKGMQQKVQFLAAVIHEPELIILDEPFSGLDPVNAEVIHRLVRELHDAGRTLIFSTHIMQQAERLCDRIVLINRGRKLLDEATESVRERFTPRELALLPARDADLGSIAAAASADPAVRRATPSDDVVVAALEDDADAREAMRRLLDDLPLDGVQVRRAGLEEVFVTVVGQDAGEAAAEEARLELASGG